VSRIRATYLRFAQEKTEIVETTLNRDDMNVCSARVR
jgi:hypothetical protein